MPHPKCSCIYTVEFAQKSQLRYNKSLPISALSAIRPSLNYLSSGSVNTKYNPPISSGQNVAWVKIFEQKRVCLPADSYGRVSPKQSPRWPPPLFCMLNKTSPRLELSLCAWDAEPKYRTFRSCTDWIDFAGRGKVSVRTSSAAGIRDHGQLAICTSQCIRRSPQVKRKM